MINTTALQKALHDYVLDPNNPVYNFRAGTEYEKLGQNGTALSYFLRTAEHSTNDLLCYESLLKIALCLEKSLNRNYSLQCVLLRAISLMPKRPEAYFLLSRNYERDKKWHDSYCFAVMGENLPDVSMEPLQTNVEYPGRYGFIFERAVTAWWIGLYDESMHLFKQLQRRTDMAQEFVIAVNNNIANFIYTWKREPKYNYSYYSELRYKFPGAEKIQQNYAGLHQDMFVLMATNGKLSGSYLEIGSNDPIINNNTYLLSKYFGWNGISIDIEQSYVDKFMQERGPLGNQCVCRDARKIDWNVFITSDVTVVDYLQVDCEPAITTFEILKMLPLHRVKFRVITFEHDYFIDSNPEVRHQSRAYLKSFGYKMLVNDVAIDRYASCEDWWYMPGLIDENIVEILKDIDLGEVHKSENYILNR